MNDVRRLDQVTAFKYVTESEAPAFRAIIEVFAEAKRRYQVQLRPADVIAGLARGPRHAPLTDEQIHARLDTLTEWGNLTAAHDAAAVEKLDDFYRKRLVYRLTPVGEAAHEAVNAVERAIASTGALQTTMLAKIQDALKDLERLAHTTSPDPDATKSTFDALHAAFASLTTEASKFMGELQRFLDDEHLDADVFQARKGALIAYLQGFVERLTTLADPIRRLIQGINPERLERLLDVAARSGDLPPAIGEVVPQDLYKRDQRERWAGVVRWFAPSGEDSIEKELLRVAIQSVSQLVHALHRLRDRVSGRIDRSADFRALARWFEVAETDADAHILFLRAFGMHSARHFHIAEDDPDLVSPRTSWWDATPVDVPVHLRRRAARERGGRTGKVSDFGATRDWLRAQRHQEEQRRDGAVRRCGGAGEPQALSQLGRLDKEAFEVLLELLDAALGGEPGPNGTRRGETEDGRYRVTLRPLPGTEAVLVETTEGRFTTPQDVEIHVEVIT